MSSRQPLRDGSYDKAEGDVAFFPVVLRFEIGPRNTGRRRIEGSANNPILSNNRIAGSGICSDAVAAIGAFVIPWLSYSPPGDDISVTR